MRGPATKCGRSSHTTCCRSCARSATARRSISSTTSSTVRRRSPKSRSATSWRSLLLFGQGPGGMFYQAFDVTEAGMGVDPLADNLGAVSARCSPGTIRPNESIVFKWAFPNYDSFDTTYIEYVHADRRHARRQDAGCTAISKPLRRTRRRPSASPGRTRPLARWMPPATRPWSSSGPDISRISRR